jgi:replicative DNA helicase
MLPVDIDEAFTTEQHQRIYSVCRLIAQEKDHASFMRLVAELNDLLELTEISTVRKTTQKQSVC